MSKKEIQFRKKRDYNQIIIDSFEFLKQEYQTIFKLIRGYVLPFIIINAVLQVHVQKNILGKIDIQDTQAIMDNFGPVYLNFFLASLFTLFVQSLYIGTFYTYLEAYIREGKDQFNLSDITPRLFSNSLLALKAHFALFVLVLAGFVLCIFPGIYFANTFSIIAMVYLFEKNTLGQSFQRSFRLVSSQWWNTLLINITGIALLYFSGVVLSLPTLLADNPAGSPGSEVTAVAGGPGFFWIWTGIAGAITSLLWIVPYTLLAMQYFNLAESTGRKGQRLSS